MSVYPLDLKIISYIVLVYLQEWTVNDKFFLFF